MTDAEQLKALTQCCENLINAKHLFHVDNSLENLEEYRKNINDIKTQLIINKGESKKTI